MSYDNVENNLFSQINPTLSLLFIVLPVFEEDNGKTEGINIFGCLKIMVELFVLLEMENNSFSQFFVTLSLLSTNGV